MTSALITLSRVVAPAEPSQGTAIGDARETLDQWTRQASRLPWHKRAARREARVMIATSRAQLICAHLERWGLGSLARVLAPLLDTRGRSAGAHARRMAWASLRQTPLGRRLVVAGASLAAVGVAVLGLGVFVATQLL